MLPGAIIYPAMPGYHPGSESFGCNGEWAAGGRISITGRYSIRNNQYCITADNGKPLGCQTIARSAAGKLFSARGEIVLQRILFKACL